MPLSLRMEPRVVEKHIPSRMLSHTAVWMERGTDLRIAEHHNSPA